MAALEKTLRSAAATALVALSVSACGSGGYVRAVSVSPPEATVYINGQKWGGGNRRPYEFNFSQQSRVFIQATCKDYLPKTEEFDEKKIRDMISTNTDVIISLVPR